MNEQVDGAEQAKRLWICSNCPQWGETRYRLKSGDAEIPVIGCRKCNCSFFNKTLKYAQCPENPPRW